MNIEEVRKYCLSLPDTEEAMPYGEDWVVFRVGGKIFLHIWLEAPIPTIAVKLLPERAENGGYPPTQNGDIRSLFWLFSLMALQN